GRSTTARLGAMAARWGTAWGNAWLDGGTGELVRRSAVREGIRGSDRPKDRLSGGRSFSHGGSSTSIGWRLASLRIIELDMPIICAPFLRASGRAAGDRYASTFRWRWFAIKALSPFADCGGPYCPLRFRFKRRCTAMAMSIEHGRERN